MQPTPERPTQPRCRAPAQSRVLSAATVAVATLLAVVEWKRVSLRALAFLLIAHFSFFFDRASNAAKREPVAKVFFFLSVSTRDWK
jgi:hypothetical protein